MKAGTKAKGARGGMTAAIAIATLLALALLAVPAQAKTYTAAGAAKGDGAISFELDVDAKAKKGKLKGATEIGRLVMSNAPFKCSATGETGRTDYGFFGDPIEIAKNGRFDVVSELTAGKYVVERHTVAGKVTGKGRNLVVTGTYMVEKGAGGLEFNNCSTGSVAFQAKAKL